MLMPLLHDVASIHKIRTLNVNDSSGWVVSGPFGGGEGSVTDDWCLVRMKEQEKLFISVSSTS